MKHLEPKQIGPSTREAAGRKGTSPWRWLAIAAAVTLGLGALGSVFLGSADNVSRSEIQARQSAFAQMRPLSVASVPPAEVEQALDQMKLPPAERAKLKSALAAASAGSTGGAVPAAVSSFVSQAAFPASAMHRPLRLASVTLWDTHAQDGDVVAIESGGYFREIPITKAPQSVTFPVDATAVVKLVGIRDGGGGITLGLRGPNQEILMPIMSEGQTLTLPVAR